jgi:cytochrome P450
MFILFPQLDTKYLSWFKRRQEVHDMLTEFIGNINDIINQKRQLVKENKNNKSDDAEKDLVTLMIESEGKGEGEGLSNEELQVQLIIHIVSYP